MALTSARLHQLAVLTSALLLALLHQPLDDSKMAVVARCLQGCPRGGVGGVAVNVECVEVLCYFKMARVASGVKGRAAAAIWLGFVGIVLNKPLDSIKVPV